MYYHIYSMNSTVTPHHLDRQDDYISLPKPTNPSKRRINSFITRIPLPLGKQTPRPTILRRSPLILHTLHRDPITKHFLNFDPRKNLLNTFSHTLRH